MLEKEKNSEGLKEFRFFKKEKRIQKCKSLYYII